MNRPIKLLIVGWSCVMMAALLLLMREYSYMVNQSYKLIALKAEYENHLMAVSRIIYEYNTLRERSDADMGNTDDEKKNEIAELKAQNFAGFPEGSRVVSSNDLPADDFLIINRELGHLKKSSIAYMHKQKLSAAVHEMSPHQWQDYTEHVRQSQKKKGTILRRSRSGRQKRALADRAVREHKKKLHTVKRDYQATDFEFTWPVDRALIWLSSLFGPRKKADGSQGFHWGVDMAARKGTPVSASAAGMVIEARREKDSRGYGNTIVIAHNNKYRTRYAHLHTMKVQVGQQVDRGQLIGTVGDTGLVRSRGKDASHLHFEVYVFGKKVDPLAFLS
ncbi:M23 family metallopeptidase [Candidatus Dependentiae bacterium]|nr:M23 family metallopeptidase [Candidatus Dependentiae bacterium]MCC7415271.1 M23 family metallopeptidase [Campylobacterota bacterium]